MPRTKKELKEELKQITDTVDINMANQIIAMNEEEFNDFKLTKTTLNNIAKWALDGKSESEIANNLELNQKEWKYLCKVCPAIIMVMQHSRAYADLVVAGTLYQTAIGGNIVVKKVPIKIKEYNDYGKCVGEHVEIIEVEEVQQPNPYLLKFLVENKLSEKFGKAKVDNSKEHREVIDSMSEEALKAIESLEKNG